VVSSLTRAFGIVGTAGLVRSRRRKHHTRVLWIVDLRTVGHSIGDLVGQCLSLAAFGTVVILVLLWILESFERTHCAPEQAIGPVLTAIERARQSVDVVVVRLDTKDIVEPQEARARQAPRDRNGRQQEGSSCARWRPCLKGDWGQADAG